MQLQITHETHYDYAPAVDIAQHIAYLQPLNTPTQQLLGHNLVITPEPAQRSAALDVYGNVREFFLCKAHTSNSPSWRTAWSQHRPYARRPAW